jgi:hypothetical protein
MGYICAATWRDLTDGHLYHVGDAYPFDGRDVDDDRLAALETGRNRAGLRLILAAETENERAEGLKENAPESPSEGQKTASSKPARTKRQKAK